MQVIVGQFSQTICEIAMKNIGYLKRRNSIIPRSKACQPSVRILHNSVILQFKCNTHNKDNSKSKTCNLLQHLKYLISKIMYRKKNDRLSNYSKPPPN